MRCSVTLSFILALAATLSMNAQVDSTREMPRNQIRPFIVDTVIVHCGDIFEGVQRIPLISSLMETFHAVTKEKVIHRELFFGQDDTVTQVDIDELEQNMRRLAIFADIAIRVVVNGGQEAEEYPYATIYITTRDAFTLLGSVGYAKTEDVLTYSLGLKESNLFGLAKQVGGYISYTDFNDRGFKYGLTYLNPNVWGSHVQFGGDFGIAKEETSGSFFIGRPFFSDRTRYAFNTYTAYYHGDQTFNFRDPVAGEVLSPVDRVHRTILGGWFGHGRSSEQGSVFTASVSVMFDRTIRELLPGPSTRYAFENTASFFGGISSRKRRYTKIVDADFEGEQQVPIGAMGSVTIGKISPHSGGLDNVAYVGADARQAVRSGDFYGFASIAAGTGLGGQSASFTTQRVAASGVWLTNPGALAAYFEESTVWNWSRYLFLPLDNATGLRGHSRLHHFGHNRMFLNLEYRMNPLVRVWIFDLGAAAFYDIGAVWNQSEKLGNTQFHSSLGFGVRVGNAKAKIQKGLLRVDIAYDFDERKLSRFIVSTEEAFDVFGTLDFRPPAPYTY